MMTGTIAVSELGGPITRSPFGPSQPSAPTPHMIATISPSSVSNMSDRARVKSRSRAAISNSASPTSGPIPSSVAFLYASSMIADDRLLTRDAPSSPAASSLILRSASSTRSSPVSRRRTMAIATSVPSVSVPVISASASPTPGTLRAESICSCVTDSKLSTWSTAPISDDGATTGSPGANSATTPGSWTISSNRLSIWERPPGVSASPRKRSVTTITSPESPNRSSISCVASAMGWPGGRKATLAPSVGGRRCAVPITITTVTMRRTRRVSHGRTVTSRLSLPSMLFMVCAPVLRGGGR